MAYTTKSALHLALWEGGGEVEVEAVITFTVTKFSPATHEQPEEPPMAEVSDFRIRKPKTGEWLACPAWISDAFESDDSFMDWLVSEAQEQNAYAEECAAEASREERHLLENEEMARHFEKHPHG
ncbi:hypothetical protein NA8A_18262 [Nitratireductor indicus C115]|uniref:Uncharacterized protein n=1 Tax=Nitratireductor indicus C115 TaxID=1231190 RepID=K2PI73_9HYPH|nr:hypothetical protein [Nitratireductor indicus]EKF40862.1 hypothetical protein NA8A_18262 [Nitratireductor indicus C115]SFQ33561.1 hypothetical protein SAMN05216176_102641 [Nitratireductor indicus]